MSSNWFIAHMAIKVSFTPLKSIFYTPKIYRQKSEKVPDFSTSRVTKCSTRPWIGRVHSHSPAAPSPISNAVLIIYKQMQC